VIDANTHNKARKLFDEFGEVICRSRDVEAILLALTEVVGFTISTIPCPACRHDAAYQFGHNLVAQLDRIDHSARAYTNGQLCRRHRESLQ
jgi:hypothetical protein